MVSLILEKMESYDHASSISCLCFKNMLSEADLLLLYLKNFNLLVLNLSTSSITSASFSLEIDFAYTERKAFPFCSAQYICKTMLHILFCHSGNQFLHSTLFISSFPFHFLFVLFQTLSQCAPSTGTAVSLHFPSCNSTRPLLEQILILLSFL